MDKLNTAASAVYPWQHLLDEGAGAAAAARTSEANLKPLFSQVLGQRFSQLLTQLRVTHAGNLLRGSLQNLDAIAAESGFASSSNFHRLFARQTGLTPAAFRRQRVGA
ncbi:helix-turn-helix transcriptional regulator [Chitinilyticum piscinae]|uniref:Helix-turn-helix transcriptional regulator n=1 Tax=Chitinilyticum piscinae TaxID=2866724 RepID=A0A8J7FJX2_9NEIS|nr:helix-turn-helix transcriptional regulator [Chitinilyticum piscinae]MBE9609257.1 helix-turn-helix transcriptional regulator [Chitinilyticum piscinae]